MSQRTTDYNFLPLLRDAGVLDDIVVVNEKLVYYFDHMTGLWVKSTYQGAAQLIREDATTGILATRLSPVDKAFLQSVCGPVKVIKAIDRHVLDAAFEERLNQIPEGCLPFTNGMLDLLADDFRPFVREDFITATIGYEYRMPLISETLFMQAFYDHVFPGAPGERERFQRTVSKALFSKWQEKHFIVLSDVHESSSGKSTLMAALHTVFGSYRALAEHDFLYKQDHAQHAAPNAKLLAFKGKRLACFDGPVNLQLLDISKIKDLTSGDARIRGRAPHSNVVIDAPWRALMIMCSNENVLGDFSRTDTRFIKRMLVFNMRARFLEDDDAVMRMRAAGDMTVFSVARDGFHDRLRSPQSRLAHLHVLIQAYKTHVDQEVHD